MTDCPTFATIERASAAIAGPIEENDHPAFFHLYAARISEEEVGLALRANGVDGMGLRVAVIPSLFDHESTLAHFEVEGVGHFDLCGTFLHRPDEDQVWEAISMAYPDYRRVIESDSHTLIAMPDDGSPIRPGFGDALAERMRDVLRRHRPARRPVPVRWFMSDVEDHR